MTKNTNFLALLLSLLLTACTGEYVPDPFDPRVPAHPATGYDAAGALINDQVWRAVENHSFLRKSDLKIITHEEDSTIHISIDGNMMESPQPEGVKIEFVLNNRAGDIINILNLNGRSFTLDGQPHYARLGSYYEYEDTTTCKSISGQLHLTSVGAGLKGYRYSLQGTFGFIIDNNSCDRMEVLKGRFAYDTNFTDTLRADY